MLSYSVISSKFINAYLIKIAYVPFIRIWLCVVCLSSAESPAGFPNKNSNNRKTGSARRREVLCGFLFEFDHLEIWMKHLTNGEKGVEKAHFLDQNVGETNLICS